MHVYNAGAKPVQELRALDFLIFLVFDHDSTSRGEKCLPATCMGAPC